MDSKQVKKRAAQSSRKARKTAARLAAVQAVYQFLSRRTPMEKIIEEYIAHRLGEPVDDAEMILPDWALFKDIVAGVETRLYDLESCLAQNLKKRPVSDACDTVQSAAEMPEPLLEAIMLCGAYELMAHAQIDSGIIINDYLEATHAFYGQGEAKLVNGVLDALGRSFRDGGTGA